MSPRDGYLASVIRLVFVDVLSEGSPTDAFSVAPTFGARLSLRLAIRFEPGLVGPMFTEGKGRGHPGERHHG